MISFDCPEAADTRLVAAQIAALCRPGDVISLSGSLGSGKTTFVSGLADGLGIDEAVTSPSFVLMRRYDSGFLPLVHVDVYRLGTLGEFDDLEVLEEARDAVLVIEWGEAVAPHLPADRLEISISIVDGDRRMLAMEPAGSWNARRLSDLTNGDPA